MIPKLAIQTLPPAAFGAARHPNEVDLRRIARALEQRARYRYVSPSVEPVAGGYRVVSPCCSRNIDADGGIIDIARLEFDEASGSWGLFHKDHQHDSWQLYANAGRLGELLTQLNEDPARVFWQ